MKPACHQCRESYGSADKAGRPVLWCAERNSKAPAAACELFQREPGTKEPKEGAKK